MAIDNVLQLKYLLSRCIALKESMLRTLNDSSTNETGRYSSFKTYATAYYDLSEQVIKTINVKDEKIMYHDPSKLSSWGSTMWGQQKKIIEDTLIYTDLLISLLKRELEFVDDEYTNLENFIKTRLRSTVFSLPEKEKEIQNAIETLFIGKGWSKGIDYDRETGKVLYSGREYIPDFIINKLNLCIEVKLLRSGKKNNIIEEINADIPAYSKEYKRILFIVYDLGEIRDEYEFRRDIENAGEDIKVVIVKH